MPDRRISPARLAPGVGVVGVVCLEYRDTDIGTYTELGIVVALNEPWFLTNFPGRAVVAGMRRRQLHSWVHHLPVTTEIAPAGGVEFYNYPKFLAAIAFEQTEARTVCRLHEGQEHILTLSGKRIPTSRSDRLQLFSHLWMQGQPQSSEFKVNATELGTSFRPDVTSLALGDRHPIAQELAELLLSRRPTQYVDVPPFEGILFGPERLTLPSISRSLVRDGAHEHAHTA